MRWYVVNAVLKRNVRSYFSGLIGYLFISVFVILCSIAAFNEEFFTNNLATFDQLTDFFPLLLVFFIPAVTMSSWSEEKRQGTDELLFTQPVSDLEIVLGKYLSVLTVYTLALSFSGTLLIAMSVLADPDWGLIFATWFGYWIVGAALLSAGMFASSLTRSPTVAFVLAGILCAIPVSLGLIDQSSQVIQSLSIPAKLDTFGLGLVSLSGLVYFSSFTAMMLYFNLVVIGQRHWNREGDSGRKAEYVVRILSVVITVIGLNIAATKQADAHDLQADMTAEEIFTLTDTTRKILSQATDETPIEIKAFLSPEVPHELADHHARLLGMLRQYDTLGGDGITVGITFLDPASVEAEEANYFGINERPMQTELNGRFSQQEVFLGAVVTGPHEEVVIPYFETGTSIEYELTRSIQTALNSERKTVGILRTDARVNGGMNMQSFQSLPSWQIKAELEKQYNVEEVSPDSAIEEDKYDVLIAVMPSSMTQPQMSNFIHYVKAGNPTLIFDDPLPTFNIQTAPKEQKPAPGGGPMGMMGMNQQRPEPKADGGTARTLMDMLEVKWDNGEVIWDSTGLSLHPEFGDLIQEELVFISPSSGSSQAFSSESEVTDGLQELLAFFPGQIVSRDKGDKQETEFTPLLITGGNSGALAWEDVTQRSMFGLAPKSRDQIERVADDSAHVLAAHIEGKKGKSDVDVIYVADADLISDQLFGISQSGSFGLQLDNVRFVLNAVDTLAGDMEYVSLRKSRQKHRVLTKIQQASERFRKERRDAMKEAREESEKELEEAKESFAKQVEEIEKNEDIGDLEKQQRIEIARRNESRLVEVREAEIEKETQKKIKQLKAAEKRQNDAARAEIRVWTVLLPPIPTILLGLAVLFMRAGAENRDIEATRLRRNS